MYIIKLETCLLYCIWPHTLQPPFTHLIKCWVSLSPNLSHMLCDKRSKCGHIQSTCLWTTFSRHHWNTLKQFQHFHTTNVFFFFIFLQIVPKQSIWHVFVIHQCSCRKHPKPGLRRVQYPIFFNELSKAIVFYWNSIVKF